MDILAVSALYFVFCGLLLYFVFGGFLWGAMWMHLPNRRVKRILELVDVRGKAVYDLGSGYGNIAFKVAGTASSVVAVEVDWFKAWWIRWQIKRKGLKNVSCLRENLLNVDLSKADVLLCYLSDGLMKRLSRKQLKQDAVIASVSHRIKGLNPTVIDTDELYPIYVY
jgi:predicted RNA methylase